MTLTTSVVICAYTEDRWSQLLAAVASVRAQNTPVDEIVVVIDHHDRLLDRTRTALPDVQVVANQGPKGLSGARNTGTAQTSADIVFFLDDDATAEPTWTTEVLAAYRAPDVLGVGGAAVPVWESSAPAWWPEEFGWVIGCSYRGQPTSTAPVRNLMGCNMSVRRTVLDAVGGFDTGLGRTADRPLGCEETELCIRARKLFPQGRFVYEPRALVHHAVPPTRASWAYFRARCRAEGISKAWVTGRVGREAALSAEQAYVSQVLPTGVVRSLRSAAHGDLAAVGRAGAIVAGLAITAGSYLLTRASLSAPLVRPLFRRNPAKDPSAARSEPVKPLVIDLSEPSPAIDARRADGVPYASAVCLVTRSGDPVGKVRLDLAEKIVPSREVEERLRNALGTLIADVPAASPATTRPTSGPPGATVVVATRDRPDLLQECVRSIFGGTQPPERLVVVDNAPSTDDTARLVRRLAAEEPRLVYVREDRPGLARAHNAALPHVDTPLVAFTDDDVVVDARWLERLAGAFADDSQVSCVTGMIAPRELETLPQQWIEGNVTYDKGLQRRVFDNDRHRPGDPLFPFTAGAFGSGANMAFRTSFLRGHGGFDNALGTGTVALGGDDLAAFYDVIATGHRLVYEPSAIVLHRHHRQYAGLRRQTYGYGAGLGAHLTRCFLREPRMALVLLRHATTARRRATRIVQPPTVAGLPAYPADLSRQQLRGLASGPWRYLVSRRRLRREAA